MRERESSVRESNECKPICSLSTVSVSSFNSLPASPSLCSLSPSLSSLSPSLSPLSPLSYSPLFPLSLSVFPVHKYNSHSQSYIAFISFPYVSRMVSIRISSSGQLLSLTLFITSLLFIDYSFFFFLSVTQVSLQCSDPLPLAHSFSVSLLSSASPRSLSSHFSLTPRYSSR